MTAPVIGTRDAMQAQVAEWHAAGESVGVVPTMGALHAGHLSLVEAAKAGSDRVIVTIFVNPKQFDNPEDLTSYPKTEDEDRAKLAPYDVDMLYAPTPDEIYPDGFATSVSVAGITDGLCGAHRPGHFDGVATVVTKLFTQTMADKAYFGEKDYQQLLLVTRLTQDLDLMTQVVGCPTVREKDGLAMSSRNLRLLPEERAIAPLLHQVMQETSEQLHNGMSFARAVTMAQAQLVEAGFTDLEYLELRTAATLAPLSDLSEPARLLAAANLGDVRLIDNIAVDV